MILAWVGTVWACGPDFPVVWLDDRVKTLSELPAGTFLREVGSLVPPEPASYVVDEGGDPAWREVAELAPEQAELVRQMRAERDPERALALGAALPPDLRLYTAGGVAWSVGRRELALGWWREVLALPDAPLRGVAAAYVSARFGEASYAEVRRRARDGGADPWGLAVASFGEEARGALWSGDPVGAVHLYATQAAHGSSSGAASLLFVARWLFADRDRLSSALHDPVVQALATTYAWTRTEELGQPWPADGLPAAEDGARPVTAPELLALLDGLPRVAGAERVAAAAYRAGRYDEAGRWAARSPEPLAAWVRAKLALRAGDDDLAARELASAVARAPDLGGTDGASRCRLLVDQGALSLSRGDTSGALGSLSEAARAEEGTVGSAPYGWEDAAYVAERVMTTDELLAWVDAQPRVDDPILHRLRALLARRLMRDGRYSEAADRFGEPALRARAIAYRSARDRALRGDPVARAEALLDAAAIARDGLDLFGTELAPDFAVYEGDYAREPEPARSDERLGPDELGRVHRSAPRPDVRFHYRSTAADLAVAAADRLPTTSLAYVTALCRAAAYARRTDEGRVRTLWDRYVATGPLIEEPMDFGWQCPPPDWPGARAEWIRTRRSGTWAAVAVLAGGLLTGFAWLGGSRWRSGSRS
ncbi:MAG: hypothetical protein ABMA64_01275 [Myxococcota bacterium]